MFSFTLQLAESCLQEIIKLSSGAVYFDLFMPEFSAKMGNLAAIFDSSLLPEQPEFVHSKNGSMKRRATSIFDGKKKQKTIQSKQEPVDGSLYNESILVNKVSPESLIQITQNLTTGDKNFQCSMCGYSSNQKSATKRHIELKHLPKTSVFKCQLCDVTANLRHNLKVHYTNKHSLPDQAARAMLM